MSAPTVHPIHVIKAMYQVDPLAHAWTLKTRRAGMAAARSFGASGSLIGQHFGRDKRTVMRTIQRHHQLADAEEMAFREDIARRAEMLRAERFGS